MKVVSGFSLRKLGRDHILVPEGMGLVNFNKMISLNSTAAYLWECVQEKEFTGAELVKSLVDKYDVAEDVARKDVEAIIAKWLEVGIITE